LLYSAGKIAAPYVKEGYRDLRGRFGEQDLSIFALLKAADELYSVGKVAAPYVKEGYKDFRSRFGD